MDLETLYKKQTELLMRISGLTDCVLIEQVQEEYLMLENKIAIAEEVEIKKKIQIIYEDLLKFYHDQYTESDIITALEKTNKLDLHAIMSKHRIRPQIKSRKDLCTISNTIKKKIIVCDLENRIVDEIGCYDASVKYYIGCLSYIDGYDPFKEYKVFYK
jgi:hypothetical protein